MLNICSIAFEFWVLDQRKKRANLFVIQNPLLYDPFWQFCYRCKVCTQAVQTLLAAITLFLRSFITVLWKPQNLNTIFFLRNDEQKIYTFLAFAQSVFVVLQCSTSIRYVCNLALNVNSWKNYCTRRHGTALLSNVNCDLMRFRLWNFELFYTKIINVHTVPNNSYRF